MITKTSFEKDNYYVDFVNDLSSGETLTISSVTATDMRDGTDQSSTIISTSPSPSVSGTQVYFWYEGGTVGHKYLVSVKVTTSQGRDLEATVEIQVVEEIGA